MSTANPERVQGVPYFVRYSLNVKGGGVRAVPRSLEAGHLRVLIRGELTPFLPQTASPALHEIISAASCGARLRRGGGGVYQPANGPTGD